MDTIARKKNHLKWFDINLSIKQKNNNGELIDRMILSNIEGEVYTGQLLAIQGPSGCGKTSLINILTDKVVYSKKLKLTGTILYNEQQMNKQRFDNNIVSILQDDVLFSYLTVRETLYLSASFHMKNNPSSVEIENKVEMAISELGLKNVTNTIVGSSTRRGVSGGEYKRVMIGKELMKNPSVLFIDEPTSGLDAFQALAVMEAMKTLAENGRIVITVIHQPRSSIFALFDILLLLSEGKLMYFGPSSHILTYLARIGYVCPEFFNPADFYLDLMSLDSRTEDFEAASRLRLDFMYAQWRSLQSPFDHSIPIKESNHSEVLLLTNKKYLKSWIEDFGRLTWRATVETMRNYSALLIRSSTNLFLAVIISLIYHNLGYSQTNIQDRVGILYFVLINQSFSPLVGILNIFPQEKQIVTRETVSGAYLTSSYFLSKVISELPMQILITVVYCSIIYWSVGLNPKYERFLIFIGIINLTGLCSVSVGLLLSAISSNAVIANALGPPVLIIFILFGGFYINVSSLPVGSQWVINISFVYWAFQALSINEFTGETFTCTDADTGCIKTGEEELVRLNFQDGTVLTCSYALIILWIGFLILAYLGLLFNRVKYCKLSPPPEERRELKYQLYEEKNEFEEIEL